MTDVSRAKGAPDVSGGRYGAKAQVDPLGLPPADGGSDRGPAARGNNSALVLLIVTGVSTGVGCFPAVPALILGIFAMAHQHKSPARSAKFVRWGWITYAIAVALMAAAGAALMLIATYAATGND